MRRLSLGNPIGLRAVTKIEAILETPAGRRWLPDDLKQHRFSYLQRWCRIHLKRRLDISSCSDIRSWRTNTNGWTRGDIGNWRANTNCRVCGDIWNRRAR